MNKILIFFWVAWFVTIIIADGEYNGSFWVIWMAIMVSITMSGRRKQQENTARIIKKKRKIKGEVSDMKDFVLEYVGKECAIYTAQGGQYECVIKQVSDNAVLVETKTGPEVFNLDYIIRVREVPRNKKGQKKSIYF